MSNKTLEHIKANKWTYILILIGIVVTFILFILSGNNKNNRNALQGAYNDLIDYHKKRGETLKKLKDEGKIDHEQYQKEIAKIDEKVKKVEEKVESYEPNEITDELDKI